MKTQTEGKQIDDQMQEAAPAGSDLMHFFGL
jgi:hypothetical protein